MNKSMIIGTVLGAIGVTGAGTMASYKLLDNGPEYAEVLAVETITETIKVPREVCHDEEVAHQKPVKDKHQVTGTVLGAVVGGVLGKQVGGGNGKKLATLAGAAAGGYAGNKIQEGMQEKDTYTTTERRCQTVSDTQTRVIGYDVRYRLDGVEDNVRMESDPGERIPVVDGQLVLNQAEDQPPASDG